VAEATAHELRRDLLGTDVVRLAQVDALAHDVDFNGVRAAVRLARAVSQPAKAVVFVPALPPVEHLPADPEVAAGRRDATGDFLGVLQDRQAVLGPPLELPLTPRVL
jgi:hypothetical protein